jgi:hypothetical protein
MALVVGDAIGSEPRLDNANNTLGGTVPLRVVSQSLAVINHELFQEVSKSTLELGALISDDLGWSAKSGEDVPERCSGILGLLSWKRNHLNPLREMLNHDHDVAVATVRFDRHLAQVAAPSIE